MSDSVASCKEIIKRILRCQIELGVVRRMLEELAYCLIELGVVRRMLEELHIV